MKEGSIITSKRAYLSLLLGGLFLALIGQDPVFEKITSIDGLPENYVNCIYQDNDGFIWLGTHDGLSRYDGLEFRTFNIDKRRKDWIKSNIIRTISGDNQGNLWILTADKGIYRYDRIRNYFEYIGNPWKNLALEPNNIATLHRFGDELMIGTETNLCILSLNKTENDRYSLEVVESIPNVSYFLDDYRDGQECIWIGSRGGLYSYTHNEFGNRVIKSFPKKGGKRINFMVKYEEGLLTACEDGIYYFTEHSGYQQVNDQPANTLMIDPKGLLWASNGDGLTLLKKEHPEEMLFSESTHVEEGLADHNITSKLVTKIFRDKTGIIWIGTQNGLNKYNPHRKSFINYGNRFEGSLKGNNIRSLLQDSHGNLWVGTDGGGINFLPRESLKKQDYYNFTTLWPDPEINQYDAYCIEEVVIDNQIYILIGTSIPDYVTIYKLEKNTPVLCKDLPNLGNIQHLIFDITDDEEYVWLASIVGGLFRYHKESGKTDRFTIRDGHTISSDIVRDLLIDRQGNLWVATAKGINYLPRNEKSREKPVFGSFNHEETDEHSLAHDYVLTLFESTLGDIWVGTFGGGIGKYISSGHFLNLDVSNGLPNNVIKGILEDENHNLWISTNKGLSQLDPESLEFRNFDLNDGLQEYEFGEHACLKLPNGQLLFGCSKGITAFYPEDIKSEQTIPDVVFTDLMVVNHKVEAGDEIRGRVILKTTVNETKKIRLKYSENSFSIHFRSLHYSAPDNNKYQYKLEGFSDEWVTTDATTNFAKYTSLPPGKYSFLLKASNNDGYWNPEHRQLNIRILPPIWYYWPAYIVYATVFIVLMLFFRRYTFIRIHEKHQLMMEQFEQEKIRELSQMKLKFFTNISHEFRTPLTLITGPVKRLLQQQETLSDSENKKLLSTIQKNSAILLRLINQLMDFRKVEQDKMELNVCHGNFYLTAREYFDSFQELSSQNNIHFSFHSYSEDIPLWYDYEMLEKVFYNLLSNAFKYTPANGAVSFSVRDVNEEFIEVEIADTGIGIPEKEQKNIFERFYRSREVVVKQSGSTGIGLSLSKGLMDIHKGSISFKSEEGKGSSFFVRLRKGEAHFSPEEKFRNLPHIVSKKSDPEVSPKAFESFQNQKPAKDPKLFSLLIVEDHDELRDYLKDCFSGEFSVKSAENGEIALEHIHCSEPDLVISDIMMPKMDGIELCQQVKEDERTSHIPVILLSAKENTESQIEGYNVGADAYVPKPFDIDVLKAQVKSIIKRRKDNHELFKSNININPSEVAMTGMDEKFLKRCCELVEENIVDPMYTVSKLADAYGMSQKIMNKKLKILTGLTAKSFIRSIKLKRAAQLLATGNYTVSEVTYDVGFSDLKYFRACFKEEFSITPSDYKKIHQDTEKV